LDYNFTKELGNIITEYFMPFLCIGMVVLVFVVGIRFAIARDASARAAAKTHLVKMLSVCMIFVMLTFVMGGVKFLLQKI